MYTDYPIDTKFGPMRIYSGSEDRGSVMLASGTTITINGVEYGGARLYFQKEDGEWTVEKDQVILMRADYKPIPPASTVKDRFAREVFPAAIRWMRNHPEEILMEAEAQASLTCAQAADKVSQARLAYKQACQERDAADARYWEAHAKLVEIRATA